jgi:transcriptional regulator with XRE-family HTH domain
MTDGLRDLRRRKLLTQRELADLIGTKYQTVQTWERGRNAPRPSAMRELCAVLEVTPSQLLAALDETRAVAAANGLQRVATSR